MTKKQEEAPEVASPSPEDLAFEQQLVAAHPKRRITRFDFPESIDDAAAVYLCELTGTDEVHAAELADATMTDAQRKSFTLAAEAEQRESVRISVVGIVRRNGTRRIVTADDPLIEIDNWSSKALRALRIFFGKVNGLSADDLGKAERAARKVGAGAAL